MGYYTGSGVVKSGGREISDAGSTYPGNAGYRLLLQCKHTHSEVVLAGVSATVASGDDPTSTARFTPLSIGGFTWSGDVTYEKTVNYTYSRIGDSNLFTQVVSTSERQFRLGYAFSGGTDSHNYAFTDWATAA